MNLNPSVPITEVTSAEIGEVRVDDRGHRSLGAKKSFKANEVMIDFTWRQKYANPSYLTVQLTEDEHIELSPDYLECINHSCDPNCFFDTTAMQLIAVKDIEEGEELTFFYPSAEWDMDRSFDCLCGTDHCIGVIKGAKYLSSDLVKKYRFTDFIRRKLAARG